MPDPAALKDDLASLQSEGRRILSNSGWMIGDRVLRMALFLGVNVAVARHLGPTELGRLSYALSLVGIATGFAFAGLDSIVVRELTARPEDRHRLLGTSAALLGVGVLLALAALTAGSFLAGHDAETRRLVLLGSISLLVQPVTVVGWHFQARLESRHAVIAGTVAQASTALARLGLAYVGAGVAAFALVAGMEAVLIGLAVCVAYLRVGESVRSWRVDGALARTLLASAWPALLSSVLTMTFMNLDQVLLRELEGERAVGAYAAAARLSTSWYFVPMALMSSAYPLLVTARQRDDGSYHRRLQLVHDLALWGPIVFCVLVSPFARPLARLLLGAEYADAGVVLALHLWTAVPVCLGVVGSYWLLIEDLTWLMLVRVAVGLAGLVGVAAWGIPRLGAPGAALALLAGDVIVCTLSFFITRRARSLLAYQARALTFPLRLIRSRA